ncbi:ATP-binding protein [Bradyrhizobium sp. SSUT77]|uniref:ATP-binding protein n=1 Tax=Bradyrhizobium sp. SSUT77 TaxID=3040603 RepID=UPI0024495C68|nr:ATP-binding protein [Bradyrhizobium sp. SSUT77]MDH2346296.1 ATP-binding protein [Bradyrhizobium sp. SSUT77]
MKSIIISTKDFIQIVARDESHFFDIKEFAVGGRAVQKIAAAFSNADGGEFIVGIKDKASGLPPTERWEGIADVEKFNSHLQALFEVKPALDVKYEFLQRDGVSGYALRITLEKGTQVCTTADGTIYVRQGAQSLPVKDPDRIQQLNFSKGAVSYEDFLLPDLPPEQITEGKEVLGFLTNYSPKTDALEFCLNQNLLDFKSWQLRVVSALLFHPAPSAVIPKKCALKITRYETKEDDPERDHLAEQATIEGPAYQLIHSAVARVTEMMSSIEVWTNDGLKKIEYPPEALWETIVNAVLHRDYSISDDIQILIFDNRIEILSPGKLPGYVNIENILDARFSRNAKLVRTLNRYKDAPNKDLGEGLNTTFQKMKEFGLKDPIITEEGNYVKVILPHLPLAAPTVAIIDFLRQHDQITNRQARDLTGIRSENSVKTEFYKLRDEGHIERVPGLAGNKSAWQLTAKGKAFLQE